MSNKKTHGERNRKFSDEILAGKKYYDWVITTAFYAAIHFVEDSILPCDINSKYCKNISEVKNAYQMNGRHAARERLVYDKFPIIAHKYKWLDDRSRYSRYTTYKVTIAEAEKSKQYLSTIYNECYNSN
ncbi:MAG: hypothetical protein K9J13_10755 [Saprospiraceae bacterium]|nr:hypothetical protein [Saprospiraceae bacterium]